MSDKPIVIGVGGLARSGKDTFAKIAKKILKANGYSSIKLAFADALKEEIDPFLIEYYGISAWTENTEEKNIIRPLLVAHGCQKRVQTNGTYWIEKIQHALDTIHFGEDVVFVSDCRFPNEADWVHENGGWFVHVKKYSMQDAYWVNQPTYQVDTSKIVSSKIFDLPPNAEETKNDPLCQEKADYDMEAENVMEREKRISGNKITADCLIDNTYLNEEVKLCLSKCPLLTLQ